MAVIAQIQPKEPVPLTLADDGSYVSDNEEIKATFTQSGSSNAVEFEAKGYKIRAYPGSLKYIDLSIGFEDVLYDANSATAVEVSRDFHALYRHFPNAEERFEVEAARLKHYVTLNSEQRQPVDFLENPLLVVTNIIEFDETLRVRQRGMVMTGDFQTDADLEFIDQNGNLIFTIPAIEVWDQKQETTSGLFVVSSLNPGQLEVSMAVDNAWISDPARVYPVVIDPTVIANTSYKIATTSNVREMVKLSNGWLVIGMYYSNTIYLYVSKDSGATWQQLCYIAGSIYTNIPSLASTGTKVYVAYTMVSPAPATVYVVSFDATTVTNTDQSLNKVTALVGINGSTYMNSEASISISASGIIGVAVGGVGASGSVTDIYYASSSDGGKTWSAASKVSNTEPAGGHANHPCLIFDQNNSPVILFGWNNTTGNSIEGATIAYLNNGTWTLVTSIGSGNGLYSGMLQLAAGPDGTLYLIQSGADGTNGYNSIGFSKSTDNGHTWSAVSWIVVATSTTQTYTNPTIAIDPAKGDLYVFFVYNYTAASPYYYQIRMIKFTASTNSWGSVTNITSNVSGTMTTPTAIGGTYANMNATDAIYYAYSDSTNGIIAGAISIDQAPNAPALTPENNFTSSATATFNWTFSDPTLGDTQSAFQLQILDVASGTNVVDTGKVASTASSYTLAANTLTNGKQYQWRVMVWNQSGLQSPWSSYGTFTVVAPPTVNITTPTANAVLSSNKLTVQWSYSDPANYPQQSYDVQLLDANGNVLWDSGTVNSASNQQTIQYAILTGMTYKVKVTVTNNQGIVGASATVTFSTNFTLPAVPQLAVLIDSANARNSLTITNPAPTGTQPDISYNDLYRRVKGTSDWMRIATNIPANGSYNDYAAASGTEYEYKVTANGTNTASADSAIVAATLYLTGIWIHDVTNPTGTAHQFALFDTGNRKSDLKPDASMVQFAGRTRPRAMFGISAQNNVQANLQMLTTSGDWQALQSLINSRNTLCYRDARGRKIFGVILELPVTDYFYGSAASIQVNENSYTEGV